MYTRGGGGGGGAPFSPKGEGGGTPMGIALFTFVTLFLYFTKVN